MVMNTLEKHDGVHDLYYPRSPVSRDDRLRGHADYRIRFTLDNGTVGMTVWEWVRMEWREMSEFSAFHIPSHLRLAMDRVGLPWETRHCMMKTTGKAMWDELRKEGWVQ